MKKFLFLFSLLVSFSYFPTAASPNVFEVAQESESWNYTTGKHSDGTCVKVRYNDNTVQVFYNSNWHSTTLSYDSDYKSYYVKTPANKRYYVQL